MPNYTSNNKAFRSDDICSSDDAIRAFGEDTSLLVARPERRCCSSFWFTIPDGFFAIVTKNGVQVDYEYEDGLISCVWPPGLHFGLPSLKVSHLVTKQDIVMNSLIKECKTRDNILVNIKIAIVFRIMGDRKKGEDPSNVYNFVHHVTARGLEEQLKSAQEEQVRNMVQSINHADIYGLQTMSAQDFVQNNNEDSIGLFDDMLSPMARLKDLNEGDGSEEESEKESEEEDEVGVRDLVLTRKDPGMDEETKEEYETDNFQSNNEEVAIPFESESELNSHFKESMKLNLNEYFNSSGIEVTDVIVHGVTLPEVTRTKMAEKTIILSNEKEKQAKNYYDFLQLIHKEEVLTMEQSIEEEKKALLREGEHAKLLESLGLLCDKAQSRDVIEKIKTQGLHDVNLLNYESDFTVQKIMDMAKLESDKITLETIAEATVAKEDAIGEANIIRAVADMEGAYYEANAQKVLLKSEVIATPMLRHFNKHNSKKLKVQVFEALANNDRLVITGNSGGLAANRMLMVDAALVNSSMNDTSDPRRKAIIDELNLLSGR